MIPPLLLSRTRIASSRLLKHLFRCQQSRACLHTGRLIRQQVEAKSQPDEGKKIYEPVIGLEVHAQINSRSKLFSTAPNDYVARPNCQVAPFDLSLPGTLPVLNRLCVETAIRTGLALNCEIPLRSTFDRKHYFYGDTPNGYQITQQREPIAKNGYIEFIVYDEQLDSLHQKGVTTPNPTPYIKRCNLKQIQIEQDSGKSLQDSESNQKLIDLNRTGIPLMEFVFEPELTSTFEASCLVQELAQRLLAIGACTCQMDYGALRVDANVSLRPVGSQQLGTRTEIKNLNSFRFIRLAIDYEIARQTKLLTAGQPVINETLGFDLKTRSTFLMRDKEIVQDYRFMPEPNLPPILLRDSSNSQEQSSNLIDIAKIRSQLPIATLPHTIRADLLKPEYQLTLREIYFLTSSPTMRRLFYAIYPESTRKNGAEIVAFLRQITIRSQEDAFDYTRTYPEMEQLAELTSARNWAQLIDLLYDQRISPITALDIVQLYQQKDGRDPETIIRENNWWLIQDEEEIERVCRQVVEQIPKIAKEYAKRGIRKPRSMLIQRAHVGMGRQVSEELLWKAFDKILLPKWSMKPKYATKEEEKEKPE